jgi:ribosomal protein L37AE/L43A
VQQILSSRITIYNIMSGNHRKVQFPCPECKKSMRYNRTDAKWYCTWCTYDETREAHDIRMVEYNKTARERIHEALAPQPPRNPIPCSGLPIVNKTQDPRSMIVPAQNHDRPEWDPEMTKTAMQLLRGGH